MRYHKPGWAIIQTNRTPDVFQVYKQTDPTDDTYTMWPNIAQHNTVNIFNTLGGAKKWLKQHNS